MTEFDADIQNQINVVIQLAMIQMAMNETSVLGYMSVMANRNLNNEIAELYDTYDHETFV